MKELGARPTALVLSGGAALGSWQAGCLYGLVKKGLAFHSVFGTSIGALNGCAYFQDSIAGLPAIWHNIRRSDFFRLRPKARPPSLFSQNHLRQYLARFVDERRARSLKRCWFYVVSTDIASGQTHQAAYSPEADGPWEGALLEHLLGSISIPFILPPVKVSGGSSHRLLLDGNTKSHINLFPALSRGAKDILFLSVVHPSELRSPGLSFRSYISTLINQFIQGQIEHSLEPLRHAGLGELRAYVFHPSAPLRLKTMEFHAGPCREAFDLGVKDSARLFSATEEYRIL